MPKPLVFISHSAKDALAKEVLDKVHSRLQPDFEVLLDQYRLEANDPWRNELDIWMGLCHVGVILFSKDALESDWVLKEATILRWRRARDESFVVVPVLFPPVEHKDLDENKKFAPLALNEIQMLTAETADDVVERIVKRLELLKHLGDAKTPLLELENLIASRLSELELRRPEALREAAAKLGQQLPWRSDNKYSEQLARALLSADPSQVAEAVLVMAPHFTSLEAAIDIIDRLTPFWVNPQAVARLPEMIKLPQKERAVCVNGVVFQFTPKSYLSRAQASIYPWISARVILPKGYEEQPKLQVQLIEEEIGKQILPQLGFDDDSEGDIFAGIADSLLAGKEKKEPLFIIVPEELDEKVLDVLRNKFSRFTFFLLKGNKALDQKKLKLKCIELLEPKLDPETEDRAFKLYFDTKGKVKSLRVR